MNVVFIILTVLIVIAAIMLIGVVLLQNSKGDGMASNFVAGNQTFGVRQTADILEKITWILVTFVLVVSIIASYQNLYVHSTPASTPIMLTESVTDEYIEEQAVEKNMFLTPALITTSKFSDVW